MPLYVHEVFARIVRSAPQADRSHGLSAEQVESLADDVARVLSARLSALGKSDDEAMITGRNRPPSIGS